MFGEIMQSLGPGDKVTLHRNPKPTWFESVMGGGQKPNAAGASGAPSPSPAPQPGPPMASPAPMPQMPQGANPAFAQQLMLRRGMGR